MAIIWHFSLTSKGQTAKPDSLVPYQEAFKKGQALLDSGKYKDCIAPFKKAIKLKPDYWEAYNKIGYAKMKMSQYKDAVKEFEKAEKIAPLNFESVKWKGISHYLDNNFTQSKIALDTAAYLAMNENIEDAELHYYRALLMFKGKSYKSALDACELAVELAPKYTEPMVLKGEIRFMMKEYNRAIAELNEAITKMNPLKTDYNAYRLRARAKFEVGDYKGAVTDWNVYIDANPKEEEALISRAAAKINTNDNTGAIADLDDAIKLNSSNPVSYCYRGVAKGGNKSYKEALKDLDQSIKIKFDYPTAYVNRAAIKMAIKDKRGACEDLEKADGLGSETAFKFIEKYCK